MKIPPTVQYIPSTRRVHRKRRSVASQSPPPPPPPPPPAVHLTAVTANGTTSLLFFFDDDVVGMDGVGAQQFEVTLGTEQRLPGESIIEFDGAHILIDFAQDLSTAIEGTLLSGENIRFDGGGVAGDGQSQPVTGGAA